MSKIQALLENEEVKTFLEGIKDVVQEAEGVIAEFPGIIKEFVLAYPKEFIAENIEETRKNIRVFTEIATAQFVTEVTNMYSVQNEETEKEVSDKLNEYI